MKIEREEKLFQTNGVNHKKKYWILTRSEKKMMKLPEMPQLLLFQLFFFFSSREKKNPQYR